MPHPQFLSAIKRRALVAVRKLHFRTKGIQFCPPNFIFFYPERDKQLITIDVGCGSVPEFSIHLIERYDAICYGVDPTEKHKSALSDLVLKHKDQFIHVPYGVCAENTTLNFFESNDNESGSLLTDHVNVIHDEGRSYEIKCLTPKSLLDHIRLDSADILKLDIEGAEYQLLESIDLRELRHFQQIFVEFHHHAIQSYTYSDTLKAVENLTTIGFESFTLDNHNYLFRRLN